MPWLDAAWQAPRWFDDDTLPFDVADRGLLLGDGAFDTSMVLGGRMVWRECHVGRLLAACCVLGIAVDPARIEGAIDGTLSRICDGALRLTVTRGAGPRGLKPTSGSISTILATAAPSRADVSGSPLRLSVSAIRRNDTSPLARIKSLNYSDSVLATVDAARSGREDALFLNTRGHVACTAVGNVLAVFGSRLVTPPLDDGVLDGIVRGALLRSSGRIGLSAHEHSLALTDLVEADAVVRTNSLRLVAPVDAIDDVDLTRHPERATRVESLIRLATALVDSDVALR